MVLPAQPRCAPKARGGRRQRGQRGAEERGAAGRGRRRSPLLVTGQGGRGRRLAEDRRGGRRHQGRGRRLQGLGLFRADRERALPLNKAGLRAVPARQRKERHKPVLLHARGRRRRFHFHVHHRRDTPGQPSLRGGLLRRLRRYRFLPGDKAARAQGRVRGRRAGEPLREPSALQA